MAFLRQSVHVDDTNSNIAYSPGDWQVQAGNTSPREYDKNVHATSNFGATVAFNFQGQAFIIYATIPFGIGTNVTVDVSIDGGSPTQATAASGSDASFAYNLFQSSVMVDTSHSVVLTNRGHSSDSAFLFDEVVLYAQGDALPVLGSSPAVVPNTNTAPPPVDTTTQISSSEKVSTPTSPTATSTMTATTMQITAPTFVPTRDIAMSTPTNAQAPQTPGMEIYQTTQITSSDTNTSTSLPLIASPFTDSQTGTSSSFAAPTEIGISGKSGATSRASSSPLLWGLIGGLVFLLLLFSGIVLLLPQRRKRKRINRSIRLQEVPDLVFRKRSRRVLDPTVPQPFRLNSLSTEIANMSGSTSPNTTPTSLHPSEKFGNPTAEQSENEHTTGSQSTSQLPILVAMISYIRGLNSESLPDLRRMDQLLRSSNNASTASTSMYVPTHPGEDIPPPAYQLGADVR